MDHPADWNRSFKLVNDISLEETAGVNEHIKSK